MPTFKAVVRRLGTPAWKRVRPFIYTRIDWRIYEYMVRNGINTGDTSWNHLLPTFLNAISNVQTLGRELIQIKKTQAEQIARLELEIASLRATLERLQSQSESTPETVTRG